MDDGTGNFTNIHGFLTNTLGLDALVKANQGVTYGFRYRALNLYGWSAFSPTTFILASAVPTTPLRPAFISASDNNITLRMFPSSNSNGARVSRYILEVDQGETDSEFSAVVSYE